MPQFLLMVLCKIHFGDVSQQSASSNSKHPSTRCSAVAAARIGPGEGIPFFSPSPNADTRQRELLLCETSASPRDQVCLSFSMPRKPDLVVRFSSRKGDPLCLPPGWRTVRGSLTLYYVGVPSKCISATHLRWGNGMWVPDNDVQFEASFC